MSKSMHRTRVRNTELSDLEYLVAEDMIQEGLDPFDADEIQQYWKDRLDD